MQRIEIDIDPQTKQRPRFNSYSGSAYTPEKTRHYEDMLKSYLKLDFKHHIYDKPVSVEVHFTMTKPKSKICAQTPPGDIDNYIKSVLDAANGVLYTDDRLVSKITGTKKYGLKGKVVIIISAYESEAA